MVVEGRDQTELREAQLRLQHSERMEALGLLTGGVAHDFNNLLTVIIGSLDLVVRRPDKANREELIGAALEAAYKAETLNKQLLAFARRTPIAPRRVDVASALRELEPLLKKAVGESIEVRLNLGLDLGCVLIDPSPFEAAILNLAVNARDAM